MGHDLQTPRQLNPHSDSPGLPLARWNGSKADEDQDEVRAICERKPLRALESAMAGIGRVNSASCKHNGVHQRAERGVNPKCSPGKNSLEQCLLWRGRLGHWGISFFVKSGFERAAPAHDEISCLDIEAANCAGPCFIVHAKASVTRVDENVAFRGCTT